jgi:hypothetical protein
MISAGCSGSVPQTARGRALPANRRRTAYLSKRPFTRPGFMPRRSSSLSDQFPMIAMLPSSGTGVYWVRNCFVGPIHALRRFRQSLEPNPSQGSEETEVTRGYEVIPVSMPICVPVKSGENHSILQSHIFPWTAKTNSKRQTNHHFQSVSSGPPNFLHFSLSING